MYDVLATDIVGLAGGAGDGGGEILERARISCASGDGVIGTVVVRCNEVWTGFLDRARFEAGCFPGALSFARRFFSSRVSASFFRRSFISVKCSGSINNTALAEIFVLRAPLPNR